LGTIISGGKKNFLLLFGDFPHVLSFEKAAQISFHNPIVELPALFVALYFDSFKTTRFFLSVEFSFEKKFNGVQNRSSFIFEISATFQLERHFVTALQDDILSGNL
jgi:hypothetical protein